MGNRKAGSWAASAGRFLRNAKRSANVDENRLFAGFAVKPRNAGRTCGSCCTRNARRSRCAFEAVFTIKPRRPRNALWTSGAGRTGCTSGARDSWRPSLALLAGFSIDAGRPNRTRRPCGSRRTNRMLDGEALSHGSALFSAQHIDTHIRVVNEDADNVGGG